MPDTTARRSARENAFQWLFALSFHEGASLDDLLAARAQVAAHAQVAQGEENPGLPAPDPFALQLAKCALEHQQELDDEIAKRLKGWKLGRISRASLALLRLAVCEILYFDDIPPGASINEAVELAKLYGDEQAPKFINGVLGSVVRERETP